MRSLLHVHIETEGDRERQASSVVRRSQFVRLFRAARVERETGGKFCVEE